MARRLYAGNACRSGSRVPPAPGVPHPQRLGEAGSMTMSLNWPELPVEQWQPTRDTVHLWTQIVGKTRLALAPRLNHWWGSVLYVTARGLTTSLMPYTGGGLEIEFDFIGHELTIATTQGAVRGMKLLPRSVADFYAEFRTCRPTGSPRSRLPRRRRTTTSNSASLSCRTPQSGRPATLTPPCSDSWNRPSRPRTARPAGQARTRARRPDGLARRTRPGCQNARTPRGVMTPGAGSACCPSPEDAEPGVRTPARCHRLPRPAGPGRCLGCRGRR